ncbi:hypothetical protein GF354_01180 [Candidatus Peregrinibacteria bacterium]|nr:hypothetical protein [Candidatus Peregrinibacteria bacterium]
MSISTYLQSIQEKIYALLADKKYRKAYNLYIKVADKFPPGREINELGEKVNKAIAKANREIVNKKLEKLKPLWKEEKYKKILLELRKLLTKIPNDYKLIKNYQKAQRLYKEQVEEFQAKYEKEADKKLKKLLKTSEEELLSELFKMEKKHPGSELVRKITKKYRTELIRKKINSKSELLNSEKYDIIEAFIKNLEKIDKENALVKDLKNRIKLRHYGTLVSEKSESVYKAVEEFNTLYKLKKYDKAVKLGEEILEVDEDNKELSKKLKKAKKKLFRQNRNLAVKMIISKMPNLKADYKSNKKDYIKL